MPKFWCAAEVFGEHVCEVMRIDDHFANAEGAESSQGEFEKCAASDFNQCFGAIVGQWAKTRAQSGGKNHRLH